MKNQIESLKPVLESKRNELVQYIRSLELSSDCVPNAGHVQPR